MRFDDVLCQRRRVWPGDRRRGGGGKAALLRGVEEKRYRRAGPIRPAGIFPRLDQSTLYALSIDHLTGKEIALPEMVGRWPAIDRSKTPNAGPPISDQR
ncbi:MAG: hypothetical protein U1E60_12400 [Reyranellaceae bacterium]